MLKFFLGIVTLILISGCSVITHPTPFGMYRGMDGDAPAGTETFRAGWKDGCVSGMAAYGSLHYKLIYDYTYDDKMIDNSEYYRSWQMGFRHCRWYTASWDR
jgi:hypothetical protein